MLPSNRIDLGDNYELWTGLYQSAVLGSRPYLNVDIAHKAFPSRMPILDILAKMRGVDLKRKLDRGVEIALQSHLKGLSIDYKLPAQEASCRTYKFMSIGAIPKQVKFRNDQDKKEYTVESYLLSRGVQIRFPNLPTLKLGNSVKNITVPMEFCSIAGCQVI